MKNIVIIGAGDLGKELVWLIEDINRRTPTYLILGFLDDDAEKLGSSFYGYRVLGTTKQLEELYRTNPFCATIAIQDGSVRKSIVEAHGQFTEWETVIHPSAVIASSTQIGKGCIVFPYVAMSVECRLGDFGLYYLHANVCNNCKIGDYTSVMAGATVSERAAVGDECYVSAGVCVPPRAEIGNTAMIPAP